MLKSELIGKINEIATEVDRLIGDINSIKSRAEDVYSLIENLPQESSEIGDDSDDE